MKGLPSSSNIILQTENEKQLHIKVHLGEVVVEVAPIHQVEDEAELVGGVEGVGHAHDEGTVVTRAHLQKSILVLLENVFIL